MSQWRQTILVIFCGSGFAEKIIQNFVNVFTKLNLQEVFETVSQINGELKKKSSMVHFARENETELFINRFSSLFRWS